MKLNASMISILVQVLQFASPQVQKLIDEAIDRVIISCENSDNKWDDVLAAGLRYLQKDK